LTTSTPEVEQTPLSLFVIPNNRDLPLIPLEPGVNLPGVADSVLNIGWCLPPAELDIIKASGGNAYALLVVGDQDGNEQSRQLVPLSAGGTYVRFPKVGLNRLYATVVWDSVYTAKEIIYGRDDRGRYEVLVLEQVQPGVEQLKQQYSALVDQVEDEDDEIEQARLMRLRNEVWEELDSRRRNDPVVTVFRRFKQIEQLNYEFVHEFDVPRELFGDNWAITQRLASFYHWKTAQREECDVRYRALVTLFSLFIYLPFLLLKQVVMVVAFLVGLAFFGLRQPEPAALLHPRRAFLDDLFGQTTTSIWFTNSQGRDRKDPLVVVNPVGVFAGLALAGVVSFIVMCAHHWHHNPGRYWVGLWHNWWMYAIGAGASVAVVMAVAIVIVVTWLASQVSGLPLMAVAQGQLAQWRKKRRAAKALRQEQAVEAALHQLDLVACGSGPTKPAPAAALQRQAVPTALSYEKLKARLCRPLPR
jgi:uncharacterized membrane protein